MQRQKQAATVGEGPGVARIECNRVVEVLARAGKVAFRPIGAAAVVMQDGEVDRLVTAGVDQSRAGRDAFVDRRTKLTGAATLVGRILSLSLILSLILRARRQRRCHECAQINRRERKPS